MTETKKIEVFNPLSSFPLKLALPAIYPGKVFIFNLRVQLVEDAEAAQKAFIGLSDVERKGEAFHRYDVEMLATLSTAPPEGFPDFPEQLAATNGQEDTLADRMRRYFFPDDLERRAGMRFICRRAMAYYWDAVQPDQYL